MTLFS